MSKKETIIFQGKNGEIEFKGDIQKETIWATQAQIAEVFDVTPQNVTMHIKNIYSERELFEKPTCKESLQVQKEGNRAVERKVNEYNLDVIIAVGYRVNSVLGTKFRQWATKTLRDHLVKGYTINRKMISKNYEEFLKTVEDLKRILPRNDSVSSSDTLELIKFFAGTWLSLDTYDKENFSKKGLTKKQVQITADELISEIVKLKSDLISKNETTDIFAHERESGSVSGIVGNVFQGFSGKDVYPTIEEKAAHLLYFIIKNHPFIDGNKRSGAFSFVWFLNKAKILNKNQFTPEVLTILTILVAESNPRDKDRLIGLILSLLR